MTTADDMQHEDDPGDACTFTGGNEPCPNCPRQITALHMCGLLQGNGGEGMKPTTSDHVYFWTLLAAVLAIGLSLGYVIWGGV